MMIVEPQSVQGGSTAAFALIQRRVAVLARQLRRAVEICLGRPPGADPPLTLHDLERFVDQWATLVPSDPALRGELASQVVETYGVPGADHPRLCRLLGFDDPTTGSVHGGHEGIPPATTPRPIERTLHRDDIDPMLDELDVQPLARGETLFQQGDPSDCLYIVISGRLAVLMRFSDGQEPRKVAELGRGETVGEMGLVTFEPRSATLTATRDSVVARLSREAFERVSARYPDLLLGLTRQVITRLRNVQRARRSGSSLAAVCIVPAGPAVETRQFARPLADALGHYGRAQLVSAESVDQHLGPGTAASLVGDGADHRLLGWLNDLEASHEFVVYQADPEPTPWTERCLRQADLVLLVGDVGAEPLLNAIEHRLFFGAELAGVRRALLLLHPDRDTSWRGTQRWLDQRPVDFHLHAQRGNRQDDLRVARRVLGRPIGLVLGGGGARGYSHIGLLRALREHGVPIDVVGGTSMGSIISACIALGWDDATIVQNLSSAWRRFQPLRDYTMPWVSLFSAKRYAAMFRDLFSDQPIEDTWTTLFTVSSNLSTGETMVHTRGSMIRYVLASCSVPGMAPPVSDQGHLLVDGGVLNNLPVDVMRRFCPDGLVVAQNVNPKAALVANTDYGVGLSAWDIFWSRVAPGRTPIFVPNINRILDRMTMLGSIQQAASSARTYADLYLHPPTDEIDLLDFADVERGARSGYAFAEPLVAQWVKDVGPF